jgi:hypothetical protein
LALTWEQYAAQNWAGWDASDPGGRGAHSADRPPEVEGWEDTPEGQAYKAEHRKRQEWFDRHNQWQDYIAGAGVKAGDVGIKNKHEEGQSIFSGWDQNWKEAQANDPRAQQFMQSKDFGAFTKEYENPWLAYQNWQNVQGRQKSNNAKSSSDWRPMAGGGYWDVVGSGPGQKKVFYDQFGREQNHQNGQLGGMSGPTSGYAGSTGGQAGSIGGGGGMAASDYNSWEDYKRRQQGGAAGGGVGSSSMGMGPGEGPPPVPGGGGGDYEGTFSIPGYSGAGQPDFNFEATPEFNAPRFRAPTGVTMLNDPGYQFRLQQGMDALEHSKAAQGLLRGGGTLKGLQEYGQNYASQEFQNVYNRSLAEYDRNFGAAKAEFDPRMMGWQTRTGFAGQGALAGFNQQYDAWKQMQDWYLQMYNQQMQLAAGDKPEKPEA